MQDRQFLLQEHHLHWRAVVVPDILRLVVCLVSPTRFASWRLDTSKPIQTSVFDYTYLLFWNSFWTLCPVIAIGLFDRIVGENLMSILAAPTSVEADVFPLLSRVR